MDRFVTVSDERTGDDLTEFVGILLEDAAPAVGQFGHVAVFVDNPSSGFGWENGCQIANLKHLGDGKYGA